MKDLMVMIACVVGSIALFLFAIILACLPYAIFASIVLGILKVFGVI